MNRLQKILDHKELELQAKRRKISFADIQKRAADQAPALDFYKNFQDSEINIIAEVKKASPSRGVIRKDFDPVTIAQIYSDNGASVLSVLTDEQFFQGHLDFLKRIKDKLQDHMPVMRKDFVIDEYDIFEARAAGADGVLLIVAALDDHQLRDFQDLIAELGMSALVEVCDAPELERSLKIPPKRPHCLGFNNRDLKTFETDIQTTYSLLEHPELLKQKDELILTSESALRDHATLKDMHDKGVQAFLIGETLMREPDIGAKLRELRGV